MIDLSGLCERSVDVILKSGEEQPKVYLQSYYPL